MLKLLRDVIMGRACCLFVFVALQTAVAASPQSGDVPFTHARGDWDVAGLGHHRAVLRVDRPAAAAHAVVPWRRRDRDPEEKQAILTDGGGRRIGNLHRGRIDREQGEFWFEPVSGPGRYYLYYMPYAVSGRANYPSIAYPRPDRTADPDWLKKAGPGSQAVEATVEEIQSVDEFNAFTPMEVIATAAEVDALKRSHAGAAWLVFPEDRMHPVRMSRDLPLRWIRRGAGGGLEGEAARGEYFAFQLGIYALEDLQALTVAFSDLRGAGGRVLPSRLLNCLHTRGVGWDGRAFERKLDIRAGTVQPLWCGLDVPGGAAPGVYAGRATVSVPGKPGVDVPLSIRVLDQVLSDGGAGEPWKQTRLKWLDSRLAQENSVVAPYEPLRRSGDSIRLLGREVRLGRSGLPAQIRTFFAPEMTSISNRAEEILQAPIELLVRRADGSRIAWTEDGPRFLEATPGTIRWRTTGRSRELEIRIDGALEFDGFMDCRVGVTSMRDLDLQDVRLRIPYRRAAAEYMMGLGLKGGRRPAEHDWKWEVAAKNQDGAWIGTVHAGLAFFLRAENYARPLNTNFYLQKPLQLPPSWGNGGRGGITLRESADAAVVECNGGPRAMRAGETLHFDFQLIVTPFHPLDTDFQWRTRFYHRYAPPGAVRETGATVVNVHHANPINPWINYPFIAHREMKAYVDEAHSQGLKVKIYNTVRELSNRAWELFPLRSLGHEVFSPGPGGGFAWLQEHLEGDYIAAWFVPAIRDAAIVNSGMSRWHNYYVEGMNWLVRNVGIDGIYLDDVAFDRTTMKRIRRVLTAHGRPGIVDLHSANQFNPRDGFVNSALLYLEHFPYLDRLWFGEYFDYEKSPPDFYLTEISGIPFGLMGEMLQDGGNPWRGLVYGMTNRLPWSEKSDPRPVWQAWDAFGMAGTKMIGCWVKDSPVSTGRSDVQATVYCKPGAALVALASWAPVEVEVKLAIDWKALGIDPARAGIAAAEIRNFQPARRFRSDEAVPVAPGKGWLLRLGE